MLVLSIAVLVFVIDPQGILILRFGNTIEFHRHPRVTSRERAQFRFEFVIRFPARDVFDRKAIVVKPFVVEDAFCIECLDSIASSSTVSLSTSTTNL